jgi:hypothetical protein
MSDGTRLPAMPNPGEGLKIAIYRVPYTEEERVSVGTIFLPLTAVDPRFSSGSKFQTLNGHWRQLLKDGRCSLTDPTRETTIRYLDRGQDSTNNTETAPAWVSSILTRELTAGML